MPEAATNFESRLWDAMYGDVKFLVLEYKLRDSWTTKEGAEAALVDLLQYHGAATQEYWKFIRTLRLMTVTSRVLRSYPPEEVAKVVRKTDRALFRDYQKYFARYWNWEFITKRGGARKSQGPYKPWKWFATQQALKDLAAKRPNLFRHLLRHLEEQLEEYKPYKPPSIMRVLRYMRDIDFDLEKTA